MCTVCGQVAEQPVASPDLYAMLESMKHRGPDAHGAFLDGDVVRSNQLVDLSARLDRRSRIALGHSRLSIVGRRSVAQPLVSCDGRLTLLHNGEIYNFLEIRSMLHRSHEQRSGSDSEVVLHLLEELYEGDLVAAVRTVMPLLDGMYVLVVTDGASVVVARDPIGKKPLYFRTAAGVTSFASERKAFAGSGATPDRLLPGQLLHLGAGAPEVLPGFELERPAIGIVDEGEAVERYKTVLRAAIDKRLAGLSEAQVGVIYSGGIDSVLVAKLLQDAGAEPRCYCVGTEGSGDVEAARASATAMGLPVETRILDRSGVEALLPEVVHDVEESGLLQVEVAIPMYLAARTAAEDGIRVMFTGQAADELFAGYDWYRDALREGEVYLHQRTWEDFSLLYDDTLEREDKLTMAHSIELRAPYLDRDVVRTAFNTAMFLKISGPDDRMRKRIHRRAAAELGVPDSLAWRPKDPAQTGSGMHQLIEEIAADQDVVPDLELERRNLARDKGSLYRYGLPPYSAPAARTLVERIAEEVGAGGPAHPEAA